MKASQIKWSGYYWVKINDEWEVAKVDLLTVNKVPIKSFLFPGKPPTTIDDESEVHPISQPSH